MVLSDVWVHCEEFVIAMNPGGVSNTIQRLQRQTWKLTALEERFEPARQDIRQTISVNESYGGKLGRVWGESLWPGLQRLT